jgi:hypothetical protein
LQEPQCAASDWTSTHEPPQSIWLLLGQLDAHAGGFAFALQP